MATELTTSKNSMGGIVNEELPELTEKEIELQDEEKKKKIAKQKEEQKKTDIKLLEEYNIQIDQDKLEVVRLTTALEKNLPLREVNLQLRQLKDRLEQFEKYKELLEGRNK